MSGDLKHPSKAIPKGTLYGLGLTFVMYTVVIVALAASISRETFYKNTNVIQLVSKSPWAALFMHYTILTTRAGKVGSISLIARRQTYQESLFSWERLQRLYSQC